jgi:hypothetical protein
LTLIVELYVQMLHSAQQQSSKTNLLTMSLTLQDAILTEDNVKALRTAVLTLCRTLEHVESVSSDVSMFTRDSAVQRNLKTLVQALSRLVDE